MFDRQHEVEIGPFRVPRIRMGVEVRDARLYKAWREGDLPTIQLLEGRWIEGLIPYTMWECRTQADYSRWRGLYVRVHRFAVYVWMAR